jgi:ribosomal protein S18 acetylase RimI-like enzyme
VVVRLLGKGDEQIAEDACRLFGEGGDLETGAFLCRPEAALLVAEQDGQLAGWVYGHELIHPDGERTMLLYALDVAPAHRRQGHGRALVEAFVETAEVRGCTEVWVLTDDANPQALRTYRAAGGHRDTTPQTMFTWRLAEGRHS